VEFLDSSGTPLACPGATTREHDPVWEKTTASVSLNPILADQVWAREIQQGGPISLGFTPWNEICPKKYLSPGIPVVPLWQTICNKSFSIPLGFYCSEKRFSKKLHQRNVRGAFLWLFNAS